MEAIAARYDYGFVLVDKIDRPTEVDGSPVDFRIYEFVPKFRFIVAYFNTNGVGHLMGGDNFFRTQQEADARIEVVQSNLTKEHKIDYRVIPYPRGKRDEVMREHNIVG